MTLPAPGASRASIDSLADCRVLVNAFYAHVRADPLLDPVFAARIPDGAWPEHLERMAGFWYTVLFGVPLFHGDPKGKHAPLPITWQHYERWLSLWASTVDSLFEGPRAEEAKARAARMARVLSSS